MATPGGFESPLRPGKRPRTPGSWRFTSPSNFSSSPTASPMFSSPSDSPFEISMEETEIVGNIGITPAIFADQQPRHDSGRRRGLGLETSVSRGLAKGAEPADTAIQNQLVAYTDRTNPEPHPESTSRNQLGFESRGAFLTDADLGANEPAASHPWDWDGMRCTYKCRNMVKSEVLETLDAREKEVEQLKAAMAELQEKQTTADSERRLLQLKVGQLEQALAAEEGRERAQQERRKREVDKAEELLRRQLARGSELQIELAKEVRMRHEAEAKAAQGAAQAEAAEGAKRTAVEAAERDVRQLQDELRRVTRDKNSAVGILEAELRAEKGRTEAALEEVSALEEQIEDCQVALTEAAEARQGMERQLAAALAEASIQPPRGSAEAEEVIKQLREELARQVADAEEARRLKQYHANAELLREQLELERQRAERAETALATAEGEIEGKGRLEADLGAWLEAARGLPGVQGKDDLPRAFAELQREVAAALANQSQLSVQLAERKAALAQAEEGRGRAANEAAAAKAEAAEAAASLRRAERKLSLLGRERDGLKAILASYDEEEAVGTARGEPAGTPDKAKELRIQELEATLAAAREGAANQEAAFQEATNRSAEYRRLAEARLREVEEARCQVAAAEREAEQLRREVALLESRVARGDFNPATTKVLHLAFNPEAQAKQRGKEEGLQGQLAALQEKLRQLEGAAAATARQQPGADRGSSAGGGEEAGGLLAKRVVALERKEVRLKEIFQEKIGAFREACYCLFGYRVDMGEVVDPAMGSTATTVSLRSMFADGDSQQLRFRQAGAGRYELLATDYATTAEIERMVNTFLARFHSIPAFTANLTMELFNRHTST